VRFGSWMLGGWACQFSQASRRNKRRKRLVVLRELDAGTLVAAEAGPVTAIAGATLNLRVIETSYPPQLTDIRDSAC